VPRQARTDYVQPREPAAVDLDGESIVLNPNMIFPADDNIVRQLPHLFKPLEPTRQRPQVEQMTAAPGEIRGV
jgi:hypothetical protein